LHHTVAAGFDHTDGAAAVIATGISIIAGLAEPTLDDATTASFNQAARRTPIATYRVTVITSFCALNRTVTARLAHAQIGATIAACCVRIIAALTQCLLHNAITANFAFAVLTAAVTGLNVTIVTDLAGLYRTIAASFHLTANATAIITDDVAVITGLTQRGLLDAVAADFDDTNCRAAI